MKKIILALLVCFCFQLVHAEKYALIIAVGNYPKKTGWKSLSSLKDVDLIKGTLLNQEFNESNIVVLTDEDATYAGIKQAFDKLLKRINPDDILVIHYSGHGQQIFDDNDDEIDDKDEALVPYDAWVKYTHNYQGEHHFRDDELGNYITRFRNKLSSKGQLLLLLDSCHSGSTTRGTTARGGEPVFAPENWEPEKNGHVSGSDMNEKTKEKLLSNAAPFILISGASANESNYEYKGTGSLSNAFSTAMSSLGSDFSYNELFAKIESHMSVIAPKQNPTIEGDLNVLLFNNEYKKQQPFYRVKSIASPRNIIKIQAGKIQGVFENTTVNILPSGTTEVEEKNIITKGVITLSKFNESKIELDDPLEDFNEKKYWVFIDKPAYGDIVLDVFIDKSVKDKTLKNGVAKFLIDKNLGSLVKKIDSADVVLGSDDYGVILKTTSGLKKIDKDENAKGTNSVDEINQKLFTFAQGQYLKNLNIKNYNYEFEFRLRPIKMNDDTGSIEGYLPVEDFINENGAFQIREEIDDMVLEVTNKSDTLLYFTIVEISSMGKVVPFMPNEDYNLNNDERKIMPGKTKVLSRYPFDFWRPFEKLTLKGFAAPSPINIKSTVQTRGKGTKGESNPLEQFLADSYTQTRGGNPNRGKAKMDAYTTEFVYEIVRK